MNFKLLSATVVGLALLVAPAATSVLAQQGTNPTPSQETPSTLESTPVEETNYILSSVKRTPSTAATADPVVPHAANATQVAVSNRVVMLGKLECIANEDATWEGDEPYIKVNGEKRWSAAGSLDDGDHLVVNKEVNVGDIVSLYDEDWPDGDDLLGSKEVKGDQTTLVFEKDGAHYILHYRFVN